MDTTKIVCEKKPLMIAHRGCSGLERENTAAAFVAAGNRSYYGIETDVHKTLDGQFIIIHDDTTGRVAVDNLVVEQSTFETLRRLTVRNLYSHVKDRADLCLPTLAEYIAICKHYEKEAVLELKNAFLEEDIYAICDIIEEAGYLDHVIFISFCFDNLVYVRRKHPTQRVQFLTSTFDDDLIDRLVAAHFDLDIYAKALTEERIRLCHDNGIEVNTWTVNDKEKGEQLAAWGVDYITTNILE